MSDPFGIIQEVFAHYKETAQPAQEIANVIELLITGCQSRQAIAAVLGRDPEFFKEDLLDLILFFLESCMRDHVITHDEIVAGKQLKRLLKIHEGDLYRHRKYQVEGLLRHEMELIYADNYLDPEEEVYEAELQELFGLSCDQFLAIAPPPE